jgi:hypothetical protein
LSSATSGEVHDEAKLQLRVASVSRGKIITSTAKNNKTVASIRHSTTDLKIFFISLIKIKTSKRQFKK